jgi:hypothetical protein
LPLLAGIDDQNDRQPKSSMVDTMDSDDGNEIKTHVDEIGVVWNSVSHKCPQWSLILLELTGNANLSSGAIQNNVLLHKAYRFTNINSREDRLRLLCNHRIEPCCPL